MPRRLPCPTCPWRVDKDASTIPNFSLEKAEGLKHTCPNENGHGPDFGAPMFACHQSKDHGEVVCVGWLATNGAAHPGARVKVLTGAWSWEDLQPPPTDWPELHMEFVDVIEKLRRTA